MTDAPELGVIEEVLISVFKTVSTNESKTNNIKLTNPLIHSH